MFGMTIADFTLQPIGNVRSTITQRKNAPRQPLEGAPQATLVIEPRFHEAMDGLEQGADIFVFTWLHLGNRETMKVFPRGNPPLTGVFATRSPDRPNPIGLHRTKIVEISGNEIRVANLETVNGTPVIDIKPVLEAEN
jgi:tRNA-Thr(GGU) m(6)t(6)A37 methyltransferase TsaA